MTTSLKQRPTLNTAPAFAVGKSAAPHVQLGPTTRTAQPGSLSVLAFQNNDPQQPDTGSRVYIVPSSTISTGVGGVLKIFGDNYVTDQTNYRDFGLYFSADQAGDTGYQGSGAFWLNSKTNGTGYTGKNCDIGFSFQDGGTIAGRFSYMAGNQPVLVVGAGKPDIATKVPASIRLEVQGDMAFNGAGRVIRWYDASGTNAVNTLGFNTNDLRLVLAGSQRLKFVNDGSIVMGDETNRLANASPGGFFYVRAMAGAPTATPTARAGAVPLVFDDTNGKLMAYFGGVWKSVTFA